MDNPIKLSGAQLTTPKRKQVLNMYLIRTACGSYGGKCVALAYSAEEALELVNELTADQNCREIGEHRVTLLYEDVKKLQPFAHQVWDGNI